MTDDELRYLRAKLKQGEYDGVDIMSAWIAIDELLGLRAQRQTIAYMATSRRGTAIFTDNLAAADELRGLGWAITPLADSGLPDPHEPRPSGEAK